MTLREQVKEILIEQYRDGATDHFHTVETAERGVSKRLDRILDAIANAVEGLPRIKNPYPKSPRGIIDTIRTAERLGFERCRKEYPEYIVSYLRKGGCS